MRMPMTASALIGALLLGGCNTSNMPPTDTMLAGAHASLEQNDAVTARQWLTSAEPTLDNARERKEYELLMAEVEIRTGQADVALPVMNQLLAADPSDPRAHEMAGKARLMLGEFSEARQHFSVAATSYSRKADVSRAEDLGALAEGFEAYALGRVALAQDAWTAIVDAKLRAGVLGASGGNGPGIAADDGTLARFNQSNR